jgi:hypothetical protein
MNQAVHITDEQRTAIQTDLKPPSFGASRRQGIDTLVEDLSDQICKKINDLRETLDAIQLKVLESANNAKIMLQDHVSICVQVDDELNHMRKIVDDIGAGVPKIR